MAKTQVGNEEDGRAVDVDAVEEADVRKEKAEPVVACLAESDPLSCGRGEM